MEKLVAKDIQAPKQLFQDGEDVTMILSIHRLPFAGVKVFLPRFLF